MALEIAKKGKNFVLYTDNTLKILRVRASFPHLAEKWANKPEDKAKYGMVSLLNKDTHGEVFEVIEELCRKLPADKNVRVGKKDWFIKDGDDSKYENEYGHWTFNATEDRKPLVYYKDGELMADKDIDEEIQSGMIVDVIVQPWVQNNDHGTRVNASLRSVRFREDDGVRFGSAPVDVSGAWDDEDDWDEDEDL